MYMLYVLSGCYQEELHSGAWFRSTYDNIQLEQTQIRATKARFESVQDAGQRTQALIRLDQLQQDCRELIEDYNTSAEMVGVDGFFKLLSLPRHINTNCTGEI